MNSANSRHIPDLFSNVIAQITRLIGNEFDLARAEFSDKAKQATRALVLIGAGSVICVPALVLILFAVASILIERGFSQPLAYLCTGGGAALVSIILISVGINRLSNGALQPRVTIDEIQRDTAAVKEMVR